MRVAEFYVLIQLEKCAFSLMQESGDALCVCLYVLAGVTVVRTEGRIREWNILRSAKPGTDAVYHR